MTTLERPEIRQTSLLGQSLSIARRNFIHIKRMPEMLMDVTIQPVMFVLLFAFVFGSSIDIPIEGGYKAFLLPGIMAQTVAFSSFIVAVGPHRRPGEGDRRPHAVAADQPARRCWWAARSPASRTPRSGWW